MSKLNNRSKKLNKKSMKSIVAALVLLSLTAISCTDSDKSPETNKSEIESKSPQTNKSEIESKSPPARGSGVDNSITKVTGLSAKASGPTKVNLKWNSVPNAQGYWIYRTTGGVEYVPAIVMSTNYVDTALSPGTTYTYTIAPVVNIVLGPNSVAVTVTTPR
jgi:hypothetical protein